MTGAVLDLAQDRRGRYGDLLLPRSVCRPQVLRLGPKARAAVDGVLTLPMVMAPTVAGFFLLLLFSLRRPVGAFLYEEMGIKVVQTWLGCIIAASVIAFPLMYRNARAAFEQIDPELIYAARTLGMSETKLFWRVVLPAAAPAWLPAPCSPCPRTGRIWCHVLCWQAILRVRPARSLRRSPT